MKKISFLLSFILLNSVIMFSQSDKQLLVLDNYLIPTGQKGAIIGKVVSSTQDKISIVRDSAKLFMIDKQGYIRLRKNVMLNDASPFSYEMVLKSENETKAFELVKDNFIRNKVIAHRGAWKNHDASQNSMKALKKAIEIGCEASEFDVWLSSDDVVVLSHDPVIGGKTVEDTPARELYKIQLKDGDNLPSLEDYISCIKKQNKTRIVLEVKISQKGTERSWAVADSSVQMVHRLKAQAWVDYISFSFDVVKRIRELDPTAKILYLETNKTIDELKSAKISGIDYHYSNFVKDSELAYKARRAGMLTNAWTVNKEEDMKAMLRQNLDYITTDEPELLLKIINAGE